MIQATGDKSSWTREVDNREQDALYRIGRRIEIDYVFQRHRHKSSVPNAEHKIVRLFLRFEWSQTRKEIFRVHTRGCLLRKSRTAFVRPQFWLCLRLHMSLPNWVARRDTQ